MFELLRAFLVPDHPQGLDPTSVRCWSPNTSVSLLLVHAVRRLDPNRNVTDVSKLFDTIHVAHVADRGTCDGLHVANK